MNCFNHNNQPAIGICKSCGKGICPDRVVELPNGLSCKGACELRVRSINELVDAGILAQSQTRKNRWVSMLTGVIFLGFAVLFGQNDKLGPLGLLFFVLAFVLILAGFPNVKRRKKEGANTTVHGTSSARP